MLQRVERKERVCVIATHLLQAMTRSFMCGIAPLTAPHMPPFITRQWFTWSRTTCTGYLDSTHASTASRSRAFKRESTSRTMNRSTEGSDAGMKRQNMPLHSHVGKGG